MNTMKETTKVAFRNKININRATQTQKMFYSFFSFSGVGSPCYPAFYIFTQYTMILQRFRNIVGDAGHNINTVHILQCRLQNISRSGLTK